MEIHEPGLLQKMSRFFVRGRKYTTKAGCVPFPRITKSKLYLQKDISFSKQACVRKSPVIFIRRKSSLHYTKTKEILNFFPTFRPCTEIHTI